MSGVEIVPMNNYCITLHKMKVGNNKIAKEQVEIIKNNMFLEFGSIISTKKTLFVVEDI